MNEILVKDLCPNCSNCTKIIDYVWNIKERQYTNSIKSIGWLCSSMQFIKKHYRKSMDSLGKGCKYFKKNINEVKSLHNNKIINKKPV